MITGWMFIWNSHFTVFISMVIVMCVWPLTPAADVQSVSAVSGKTVLLPSDLRGGRMNSRWDVRWTHLHLWLSLKNNMTTCHHRRCQLLSDGSLNFSQVQAADAGNYSLEVFDGEGKRLLRRDFLLTVEGETPNTCSWTDRRSNTCIHCCTEVHKDLVIWGPRIIFTLSQSQSKNTIKVLHSNFYVKWSIDQLNVLTFT